MHCLQEPSNSFSYGLRTGLPFPATIQILSLVTMFKVAPEPIQLWFLRFMHEQEFYFVIDKKCIENLNNGREESTSNTYASVDGRIILKEIWINRVGVYWLDSPDSGHGPEAELRNTVIANDCSGPIKGEESLEQLLLAYQDWFCSMDLES